MARTPIDAVAKACADTRPGEEGDAVDGVRPQCVAAPGTVDEAAAVLRAAAEHDLRVVARGAGTKIGWGRPPARCDVVVDTRRMNRLVEHAAGDLVVTAEAGLPLPALRDALAESRQQLAVDSPLPDATVGGTIATGIAGPRRLLYGTVRDLLIGVTIVRADGVVASSGGRVVKNVAGYDLGKLFTGSYGTLGLVATATFRLHPLPATAAYVRIVVPDSRTAMTAVRRILHSPCVPTAVEIDRPGPDAPISVTTLVEGVAAGTAARARTLCTLLGGLGDEPRVDDRPPPWWGRYPGGDDGIVVEVAVPPMEVATVLDTATLADLRTDPPEDAGATGPPAGPAQDAGGSDAATNAATNAAATVSVRGSAGAGVVHIGLPARTTADSAAAFLSRLRRRLRPPAGEGRHGPGGHATVLSAPRHIRETIDLWGPVPALPLMRRVKAEFDPKHLLAPGRFVGGI